MLKPKLNTNLRWPARARLALACAAAATLLAACGGGDGDATGYDRIVIFGDSLSDVGTYATPGVQSLGGGKYTINAADASIWVERVADRAGVAKPCAAAPAWKRRRRWQA